MLLLPVGLEGRTLRRVPWVTLALIAINFVVLVVSEVVGSARSSNTSVLEGLIVKTLEERPYLTPGPRLGALMGAAKHRALDEAQTRWRAEGGRVAPDRLAREQKELDALADDYAAAIDRLPAFRYGFIPARPISWTLLTSMFMHGGWLHLIGNMLFLYVAGIYVEDVYGRTLYLASYLLSGLAAVLGHALSDPQSAVPLVGASGAIAGVMGIVLVRLAGSWIRFVLLPIVFLPNVRVPLSLPALVVLPFWAVEQLYFSQRSAGEGGGVAWWAHIGGFAFGAALAGVVRLLRIEDHTQGRTVAEDDVSRDVERAAALRAADDLDRADEALGRAFEKDPDNVAAWEEAYELALLRLHPEDLQRAMTRLLELRTRRGDTAAGLALLRDERWLEVPDRPPRLDLTAAGAYERLGDAARALEHYGLVVKALPRDALALRALVRQGELLGRLGKRTAALEVLRQAQAHPAMSDTWRAAVASALAKVGAG
jgi:membrane associated rhomboid family serine protease